MEKQEQLSPAAKAALERRLVAFYQQLQAVHALRSTINAGLARVTEDNLALALTQKKNLRALKQAYKKLTGFADVLPPQDAAPIFEAEFNYITTIENVLTTTQGLKNHEQVGKENRAAIRGGLVQFYYGLHEELDAAAAEQTAAEKAKAARIKAQAEAGQTQAASVAAVSDAQVPQAGPESAAPAGEH